MARSESNTDNLTTENGAGHYNIMPKSAALRMRETQSGARGGEVDFIASENEKPNMPKSKLKVKVGGLVKLNGIFDLNGGLQGLDEVFLQEIKPRWDKTHGMTALNTDARQSRIVVKSELLLNGYILGAHVEGDFHHKGRFRMRRAFVTYKGFLVGSEWSTFSDGNVWPNVMDFNGPSCGIWKRSMMIRYAAAVNKHWHFEAALEQSDFVANFGSPTGYYYKEKENTIRFDNALQAVSQTVPDVVGAVRYTANSGSTVRLAGILRTIKYGIDENNELNNEYEPGYGANLSASFKMPNKDKIQLQLAAGKGIAGYFVTTWGDSYDAVPTEMSGNKLEALPAGALSAACQHYWTDKLSSTITYGYTYIGAPDYKEKTPDTKLIGSSYLKGSYASVNICYDILPECQILTEYVYADRINIQDDKSEAGRIYFGVQYFF
ncbi:MAG: DcaP family trimeric outer membrane transporter [Cytophagales bacterium]|nr:DcaP family trimeric outer membrane transporter [Cytophagales bacterium]